jgi:glycosyltransferase involved in cell wall biosynthesis
MGDRAGFITAQKKRKFCMSPDDVTIVGVSYKHQRKLDIFIQSVLEQTSDAWRLIILHDGPDEETCDKVDSYCRGLPPFKIRYVQTPQRANQYGHDLRELGLNLVETKYMNWQNCDNYLTPMFVDMMTKPAQAKDLDFVWCDILHNYACAIDGKGPYNVLYSQPIMSRIDIANFIVRTEIAKEIGFPWRDFAADGMFIDTLMQRWRGKLKAEKVESCLLVHN